MPSTPLVATKTVILVDDDADVRRSFALLLEARGFVVRVFETGTELLASNWAGEQSCYLLDYRLPDMNGIELLKRLRHSGRKHPAFLITGDPLPSIKPRAFVAGFLKVFEKPADANELALSLDLAIQD